MRRTKWITGLVIAAASMFILSPAWAADRPGGRSAVASAGSRWSGHTAGSAGTWGQQVEKGMNLAHRDGRFHRNDWRGTHGKNRHPGRDVHRSFKGHGDHRYDRHRYDRHRYSNRYGHVYRHGYDHRHKAYPRYRPYTDSHFRFGLGVFDAGYFFKFGTYGHH